MINNKPFKFTEYDPMGKVVHQPKKPPEYDHMCSVIELDHPIPPTRSTNIRHLVSQMQLMTTSTNMDYIYDELLATIDYNCESSITIADYNYEYWMYSLANSC